MPQGIITIMILSYHSNNQHGILSYLYCISFESHRILLANSYFVPGTIL